MRNIHNGRKTKSYWQDTVVTDSFLHISGMLEPMKKPLSASGIEYAVYDEVTPNPTVLNVELTRGKYIAENCQGLIGFGGGYSEAGQICR